MKAINWFLRLVIRFRYPVTLPEEIATDLGISLSNFITFDQFVEKLTSVSCCPVRLKRFMPRTLAEAAFERAQRKECFGRNSLFSYYFQEGWLEFILHFDDQSRLRRLYLQHKRLAKEEGIEIFLGSVQDIPSTSPSNNSTHSQP